ncbi:MAG: BMP family ABC transporter substrate-binding protein [Treponema sp.]|nr:BMP family ABC transporter substrate-binding protein [Treponema sp.]
MKKIKACLILAAAVFFAGCSSQKSNVKTIAVFVPGIIADSPTFAKLVEGAKKGVAEFNAAHSDKEPAVLEIMEAGTNQAEWKNQVTALTATGKYDLILSSNPSLPDMIEPLTKQFPDQKYIILDSYKEGNSNITTVSYRQNEQAYMSGYISGLMSKTKKIGLVAAQEYPIMNNIFLPEYTRGAKDADPDCTVDFRIVGNWYDASKGKELADAMANSGVDAILPICGGAAQGVIASSMEHGTYLTWFDSNGYSRAPGHVILCSETMQVQAACDAVKEYLEEKVQWGTVKEVGLKDGFIMFHTEDLECIANVPENIRKLVIEKIESLR